MSRPVPLRTGFDAVGLRKLARQSPAGDLRRRPRSDAAWIGGVGARIVRDLLLRFNAEGIDVLYRKAPGASCSRDLVGATVRPKAIKPRRFGERDAHPRQRKGLAKVVKRC